jgi:hypothetical protein
MSSSLTYRKKSGGHANLLPLTPEGERYFRHYGHVKEGGSDIKKGLRELSKRKVKLLANFLMFENLYSANFFLLNSSKL